MRVQQLVLRALSVAVPVSNDAQACFDIYADAARRILQEQPEPPVAVILQDALRDAAQTADAVQRAWQMRRSLDTLVNDASGFTFFGVGALPLDFSDPIMAGAFTAVDDRIMGGASVSRVIPVAGAARFEGACRTVPDQQLMF